MKMLSSLLVILCLVSFTSANRNISLLDIPQSVPGTFQISSSKPLFADSLVTSLEVNIDKFKRYLSNNSEFADVLITFSSNSSNDVYFIALAANKPAEGDTLTDMAEREFSTERNLDPTASDKKGRNRKDQQKFIADFGSRLQFKGYYLNRSTLLKELDSIGSRTAEVKIVKTTNETTGQTYMDVVFPIANTSNVTKTLTSMDASTLSAGCPPFDCNYFEFQ